MEKIKHLIKNNSDNTISVIKAMETQAKHLVENEGWKYTSKSKYKRVKKDATKIKYPFNKTKYNSGGSKNTKGEVDKHNYWVQLVTKVKRASKTLGFVRHRAKKHLVSKDPILGTEIYAKQGKAEEVEFVETLHKDDVIRNEVVNTIKHKNYRSDEQV
jgi:hypothetical protein